MTNPDGQPSPRPDDHPKKPLRNSASDWPVPVIAIVVAVVALAAFKVELAVILSLWMYWWLAFLMRTRTWVRGVPMGSSTSSSAESSLAGASGAGALASSFMRGAEGIAFSPE
jgi:uncharacterized membrane protein YgcG